MSHRRHSIAAVLAMAAVLSSCDGAGRWGSTPPPAAPGVQKFVGCIGPTGQPDVFVFAVAEARNAHAGDPPGTVVPQKSPLPPGSPSPKSAPPVATVGTPGGGPTPTTRIESYRLEGTGGLNLRDHVGHTVEIVGDVVEVPESRRASGQSEEAMRALRVNSARHLAEHCKP